MVRARHPLEGRSLELAGWMRRRRQLELILVLEDGSTLLVPAKWTDLVTVQSPVSGSGERREGVTAVVGGDELA
jgi:uncharacterized protein YjeT (DUF2065 family)